MNAMYVNLFDIHFTVEPVLEGYSKEWSHDLTQLLVIMLSYMFLKYKSRYLL